MLILALIMVTHYSLEEYFNTPQDTVFSFGLWYN
jgi:hypothetical protein